MYTFVTENRQALSIERYIFATFGHNCKEDIISHDYFGTEKVIEDLKKFEGYNNGHVDLSKHMIKRNNDIVCEISSE